MSWAAIVVGGVSIAAGAIQTSSANKKRKAAEAQIEGMADSYKPNQSIMDYYSEALKRYNVNPSDSAFYKRNIGNINRQTAGALGNLQSRRSAVAGTPYILRAANDATLDTEVAAEGMKEGRFGQLGGITGMKAQEEKYPFEMRYNLQSLKAGAGAQGVNAGLSNIYGGLSSAAQMYMLNQYYKPK